MRASRTWKKMNSPQEAFPSSKKILSTCPFILRRKVRKKRKRKHQVQRKRMRHWMRLGFRAGIRWMDALAQSLMKLKGRAVTNAQAEEIKKHYADLLEYDKRPVKFRPRLQKAPRGRFGRSKGNRSGHTSLEAMKR